MRGTKGPDKGSTLGLERVWLPPASSRPHSDRRRVGFLTLINISFSERVSSYPLREVKGLYILRQSNKAGELELRKYVERSCYLL